MATTDSFDDYQIPLGWVALIAGGLACAAAVLSRLGVLPTTNYPIGGLGLALLVGGYIACFIIPPLHRRISDLEHRVDNIEKRSVH